MTGPKGLGTSTSQKSLHQCNTLGSFCRLLQCQTVSLSWKSAASGEESTDEIILTGVAGTEPPQIFHQASSQRRWLLPLPWALSMSQSSAWKSWMVLSGKAMAGEASCTEIGVSPRNGWREDGPWVTQKGKNSWGWCVGGRKAAADVKSGQWEKWVGQKKRLWMNVEGVLWRLSRAKRKICQWLICKKRIWT